VGIGALELLLAVGISFAWKPAPIAGSIFGLGIVGVSSRAILGAEMLPCGCFGRSDGPPIGWRNFHAGVAVSLASALLIVLGGRADALTGLEGLIIAQFLALSLVFVSAARRLALPDILRRAAT